MTKFIAGPFIYLLICYENVLGPISDGLRTGSGELDTSVLESSMTVK